MAQRFFRWGAGGAVRHRKVIRDSIQGITDSAIQNLGYRAGVKNFSSLDYNEIRRRMNILLMDLGRGSSIYMENKGRKTLSADEVRQAIIRRGDYLTYKEQAGRGKNPITFETYIRKILKQVHPHSGIDSDTMAQLDQIAKRIVHMITEEAKKIAIEREVVTISSKDIQTAVRIILPGELSKHAVTEGTKAVTKFNTSDKGNKENPKSVKERAGLTMDPPRVETFIRGKDQTGKPTLGMKVGSGVSVYTAAVLEYLLAELLELGGNVSRDYDRVRINPRHLFMAVQGDEEVSVLFDKMGIVMTNVGVIPHIHRNLLPKKKKSKDKE